MKNINYNHRAPYLRDSIPYDHDCWHTCVKWYLQVTFHFFKILIFQVFRGVKGQKMVQNDKKFCLSLHISGTIYHMIVIYGTHVQNNILRPFFIFSKFWLLRLLGGKRAKNGPNDQNILSRSVSQEPYIIWLSFMIHMSKMIISPGFFLSFSKFWFLGLLRGWKGKKRSKMTKHSVRYASYLSNYTSYDCHLWYTYVKW